MAFFGHKIAQQHGLKMKIYGSVLGCGMFPQRHEQGMQLELFGPILKLWLLDLFLQLFGHRQATKTGKSIAKGQSPLSVSTPPRLGKHFFPTFNFLKKGIPFSGCLNLLDIRYMCMVERWFVIICGLISVLIVHWINDKV